MFRKPMLIGVGSLLFLLTIWSVGLIYAGEPTSKGRIKFDVDVWDDAGIDTVSKIVSLKNIKASEIEPFIRKRLSRYGTVQVNDALNMIILTDKQPKVDDLSKLVQKLDVEGLKDFLRLDTESISLKYTNPETLISLVQTQISPEGSIFVDKDHTALVITDVRSKIDFIKELVEQLDRPIPQVLIEAKIMEVDNDYISKVGIDWNVLKEGVSDGSARYSQDERRSLSHFYETTYEYPNEPSLNRISMTKEGPESVKSWNIYGGVNLDLRKIMDFVNFLVNEGKAKILSTPQIVTLNNKRGRVQWGSTVYVPIKRNKTYIDPIRTGLVLCVTPRIRAGDLLTLDITTQMDNLIGWGPEGNPIISGSNTENSINIRDGKTFAIAGIEKTAFVNAVKGVPLLKSIPVLKYLFSKEVKTKVTKQLLVFITPHIIKERTSFQEQKLDKLRKIEKELRSK